MREHAPIALLCIAGVAQADRGFATRVIDYTPAPGQYVNAPNPEGFALNDPARALGAPVGGGTLSPDNGKAVTLGGFGGSITLAFDATVLDDPRNPFGVDAIVFGNALFVAGDPTRRFAEAATIEISLDVNGNGLADDPWYLIAPPVPTRSSEPLGAFRPPAGAAAGASLLFPAPPSAARRGQTWDDDPASPTPPLNAAWYPSAAVVPGIGASYTTAAHDLGPTYVATVLTNAFGTGAVLESSLGLADFTPTMPLGDTDSDNLVDDPGADPFFFYTAPDNPFAVGITPGSAGGDAFDIDWAVDPATGGRANLRGFDFIRITTGVDAVNPLFGERSAEISGVADVGPRLADFDVNGDGRVDVEDFYAFERGQGETDLDRDTRPGTARDRFLLERAIRREELGY